MQEITDLITNEISECSQVISSLIKQKNSINDIANSLSNAILNGGKLMFCGNGGSAADAQHLTAELIVRLRSSFDRKALPAISLSLDMSTLTACSNDYSFDEVYSRSFEALAKPNDVLIIITTSGRSKNLIKVANVAIHKRINIIGFLGNDGGALLPQCNKFVLVDSSKTSHIQEAHICLGHIIIRLIEENLKRNLYFR